MDDRERRLSQPVSWTEEYQWAILQELRAIRQALAPDDDGFPQCGDGTKGGKRNIAGGDDG